MKNKTKFNDLSIEKRRNRFLNQKKKEKNDKETEGKAKIIKF